MNRRTLGTRRTSILAAGALVAASALSACGEGDTGPGNAEDKVAGAVGECQAAEPSGGFEYTDARGKKIALDEVPTTVVAQTTTAAALWDAGYKVDAVYGETFKTSAPGDYQLGNVDTSEVELLGNTFGEFDVDQYAKLQPDLLVDYSFDGSTLWYVPSKQSAQIESLAPTLGFNGNPKKVEEAIELWVDLAAKLGVDTDCSKALTEDKDAYDTALADVTTNEKNLKVLLASATDTNFYVANPQSFPEAGTLKDAGVDIMAPKSGKPEIFHELSWERAADYADADVILFDERTPPEVLAKMKTIDTWANLPAVKAGQVYPWYAAAPYSYKVYTGIFDELADNLAKSEPLP